MSDNVSDEEQQQQMQEIFICADVWLEVFAFIDPAELGLKMALISDRFDRLILRATDGNGAAIKRSGERLPIPQGPLPNKVTGFEEIQISYVDQTVIEFLQRIRRLFDSAETTVTIATFDDQSRSWEIIRQKIWPLFKDNIGRLSLNSSELDRLQQFSPTVLLDCAKLCLIDSDGFCSVFPPEDYDEAPSAQAVAKWLLTARGDGRPKIFRDCFPAGVEELKGSFVNASEPLNFIITFWIYDLAFALVPFELKNNRTGERLTLRRFNENFCFLVRCPIVREEAKWANWEEEATESRWSFWSRQWNRIHIYFKDSDIGDGILDENDEGPSEPKNLSFVRNLLPNSRLFYFVPNCSLAMAVMMRINSTVFDYVAWLFPWFGLHFVHPFVEWSGLLRSDPLAILREQLLKEVQERKQQRERGQKPQASEDFIDLFLEMESEEQTVQKHNGVFNKSAHSIEKKNTSEEIVMQLESFMLAGFDTTANSLSVVSHNLAFHPEVQAKVQEEIDSICIDEDPTYEQLSQLKYTEAVVKETLRLCPIGASVMNRICSQTTTLGEHTVEEGTVVIVDVLSVHRDKNVWGEDAEQFRPERWLEEGRQLPPAYSFGGGPRICIGMRLAMIEEKLALIRILRKYSIVPCEATEKELDFCGQIVLTPKAVTVALKLREEQ
uniref:Cytochrome P450 n=1 Tax=Globodera rostochiensis TaxID=31243 RepID=A0A914HV24_GLORO